MMSISATAYATLAFVSSSSLIAGPFMPISKSICFSACFSLLTLARIFDYSSIIYSISSLISCSLVSFEVYSSKIYLSYASICVYFSVVEVSCSCPSMRSVSNNSSSLLRSSTSQSKLSFFSITYLKISSS